MAHASSLEAAKTKMKNLRKARSNQKARLACIEPEERERIQKARFEKTLAEIVDLGLYDYERHQYPAVKFPLFLSQLNDRLKELKKELVSKLEVTDAYSDKEKEELLQFRNSNIRKKINKIEGVINAIAKRE